MEEPLEHLEPAMHQPQPVTAVQPRQDEALAQRSGQVCELQVWMVGGLDSTHSESATTVVLVLDWHDTERVCVPPPQLAEQAVQLLFCHVYG